MTGLWPRPNYWIFITRLGPCRGYSILAGGGQPIKEDESKTSFFKLPPRNHYRHTSFDTGRPSTLLVDGEYLHTQTQTPVSPTRFSLTTARVADTIYMSWREGDRRQSSTGIGSEPEKSRPHYSLPPNHLCRPRPPTCTHINQLPFSIIIRRNLWPFDWTEMGLQATANLFFRSFIFSPTLPRLLINSLGRDISVCKWNSEGALGSKLSIYQSICLSICQTLWLSVFQMRCN